MYKRIKKNLVLISMNGRSHKQYLSGVHRLQARMWPEVTILVRPPSPPQASWRFFFVQLQFSYCTMLSFCTREWDCLPTGNQMGNQLSIYQVHTYLWSERCLSGYNLASHQDIASFFILQLLIAYVGRDHFIFNYQLKMRHHIMI